MTTKIITEGVVYLMYGFLTVVKQPPNQAIAFSATKDLTRQKITQ